MASPCWGGGSGCELPWQPVYASLMASCKSVWQREGPFVFGRAEWGLIKPQTRKKRLGGGRAAPRGGRGGSAEAGAPARGRRGAGGLRGAAVRGWKPPLGAVVAGGEEMGGCFWSPAIAGLGAGPLGSKGCGRKRRGLQKGSGDNYTQISRGGGEKTEGSF